MTERQQLVTSTPARLCIWALGLIYIALSQRVSKCDPDAFCIDPGGGYENWLGLGLFLSALFLVPWLLIAAVAQGLAARWRPDGYPLQAVLVLIYSAPVFLMVFAFNAYANEDDYLHVWSVPITMAAAWSCYLWVQALVAMLAADLFRSRRTQSELSQRE